MTEHRAGIVIQGPLVSTGRTGRTGRVGFRDVTRDDIASHDCVPLIARLFERYGARHDMVCVVWESDPEDRKQALRGALPPEAVHVITDDTRALPEKGPVIPLNNKYRQIRSSLAGFDILAARGCTRLGKIRSDQEIDIDRLVEDYRVVAQDRALLVPRFMPHRPDFVPDFYFMGEAGLMQRLFQAYLDKPELFESVHLDLFYHWGAELIGAPRWPIWLRESRLYSDFIRNVWTQLTPASRDLYEGLVWRGEPMQPNPAEGNVFLDDLQGRAAADLIDEAGRRKVAGLVIDRIAKGARQALREGMRPT